MHLSAAAELLTAAVRILHRVGRNGAGPQSLHQIPVLRRLTGRQLQPENLLILFSNLRVFRGDLLSSKMLINAADTLLLFCSYPTHH